MPKRPRASASPLPESFARWFASRGWQPRAHQLDLLEKARAGRSVLLVAPTGAGKTLAGFLPTLVELATRKPSSLRGGGWPGRQAGSGEGASVVSGLTPLPPRSARHPPPQRGGGLHTLYISPLKALAVDIARNLEMPVAEMGLPIRIETRTGDTPAHKRARQVERPPDILLTTPEQLALLLAHRDARELFGSLKRVVLDELHSLVTSKRGDLLALGLAPPFTTTRSASASAAPPPSPGEGFEAR